MIRRPSDRVWGLEELAAGGLFARCVGGRVADDPREAELARLYAAGEWVGFLRLAVLLKKNIVVSGATGSGKTTLTKGLVREIPSDERLISLEDAAELRLDSHPNSVRLFYSRDAQGLARVTRSSCSRRVCACGRIGSCSRSCAGRRRTTTCGT